MPARAVSLQKYTSPENTPDSRTAISGRDGRDLVENPRHRRLVDHCRRLIDLSEQTIAARWSQWQEIDKRLRCYVDPTEVDDLTGRQLRPHDVKVTLPISYAIHQNQTAYTYTLLTSQTPMMPVEARKPDELMAAQLMEEVLDYDLDQDNGRLKLYNYIHDITKYGLGAVQDEWCESYQTRTVREDEPVEFFGMTMSRQRVYRKQVRVRNGNTTWNIDPYMYIFDPRQPAGLVQRGDYTGYAWFRSWQELKQGELDGTYQNVDYIEPWARERAGSAFQTSVRYDTLGFPATWDQSLGEDDRGYVMGHTLWVRIRPTDFDLGPGSEPEIWVVTLANYTTAIRCERWDYDYGEHPVSVGEYHFDGYSPFNQGATEIFQPLQDLADWFAGARMDNMKKTINDMFVVNPSLLNLNDLRAPGPAKWLRLLPNAWGKPNAAAEAIQQLKVQDITGVFDVEIQQIQTMITQASAAINPDMGIKTATKSRATVFAGLMQIAQMRGKVVAQILSQQGIRPWMRHLVSNIQQFLDEEMFVKITGDKAARMGLDPYKSHLIAVSPEDIQGVFDFPVHTGDLPPDPMRNVQTWQQVMLAVAQNQILMQRFNLIEIFKQLLYSAGIKNIEPFMVKSQVMPDEEVAKQTQAGNLVPLPGQPGGASGEQPGQPGRPRPMRAPVRRVTARQPQPAGVGGLAANLIPMGVGA